MLKDNSISPDGSEQSTDGTTCGEEVFGSYDPKTGPRPNAVQLGPSGATHFSLIEAKAS